MIPIWRACFESCKDAILNFCFDLFECGKKATSTSSESWLCLPVLIPSSSSSIIFFPCSNTQCAIDAQEKICSVWPSSVERDMVIGRKNWWPFSVARTGSFLQRYQYSRKVTWNVSRKMDLLKGPVTTPTKKLDSEGSQQHNCNSQN